MCAQEPALPVQIVAAPIKLPRQKSARSQLDSLIRVIGKDPAQQQAVSDVVFFLETQIRAEEGRLDDPIVAWLRVAKQAHMDVGKLAFYRWLDALSAEIKGKVEAKTIARLAFAASDKGALIPYMRSAGLDKLAELTRAVKVHFGSAAAARITGATAVAPRAPGIPPQDNLLVKIANAYCLAKKPRADEFQWQAWVKTLESPLQTYWQALSRLCINSADSAAAKIETIADALVKIPDRKRLLPYRLLLLEQLALIQRHNSLRPKAAETYELILTAWELADSRAPHPLLVDPKHRVRKIDDLLFGARYQSLVGKYERAKVFAQIALEEIKALYNRGVHFTGKLSQKIDELHAEAYQVLAHRIAIEEKDFTGARLLVRKALALRKIPSEWRWRFRWYLGLYHYLTNEFAEARRTWRGMLAARPPSEYTARLNFWLARCEKHLGNKTRRDVHIATLRRDHPLDFYSLVGIPVARLGGYTLEDELGAQRALKKKISSAHDYNLKTLRGNPKYSKLLLRSEILITAKLTAFAHTVTDRLHRLVKAEMPLRGHEQEYLYLSRLLYAAHNYSDSIALSGDLSHFSRNFWHEYPEQLLISYPVAYFDIFKQHSHTNMLDIITMYAIARKESRFDSHAKSPPGALGIMQVMPSTARAIARQSGISTEALETRLLSPAFNIDVASRYLQRLVARYQGSLPAVFASYNAGEFAVDRWLVGRQHGDDLAWIELIPFGETRNYVMNAWRNRAVYEFLGVGSGEVVIRRSGDYVKKLAERSL